MEDFLSLAILSTDPLLERDWSAGFLGRRTVNLDWIEEKLCSELFFEWYAAGLTLGSALRVICFLLILLVDDPFFSADAKRSRVTLKKVLEI